MEPSDAVLLAACRQGDEAAWVALVTRYQRLIYSIARKAGLDEELAADTLQRVFAALIEHLDDIEQPALVGAWLVRTARREAWRLKRIERGAPLAVGELLEEFEQIVDTEPLPDDVIQRLEEQHRVRAALAALDERCRTLLTQLYYQTEQLTYAEIAARSGVPVGSIGPSRARCLEKLRRLLEQDES